MASCKDLQFFNKNVSSGVHCLNENFHAFVHADSSTINITSYDNKTTLCRISTQNSISEPTETLESPKSSIRFLHFHPENQFQLNGIVTNIYENDQFPVDKVRTWNIASTSVLYEYTVGFSSEFSHQELLARECLYFGSTETNFELVYLIGKSVIFLTHPIPSNFSENQTVLSFEVVFQFICKGKDTTTVLCRKLGDNFVVGYNNVVHCAFIESHNLTRFCLDLRETICSMACFENGNYSIFVVGCTNGRIVMFQNLVQDSSQWVHSIHHWHALPVLALNFSPEGSLLFSGGLEHVLVYWNIADGMSKTFLPRLSGAITNILPLTTSDELFVSLADNSVLLVSAARMITKCLQLFVCDSSLLNQDTSKSSITCQSFIGPVQLSPLSHHIVANGHAGLLQFCNAASSMVKFELDVSKMNYISAGIKKEELPVWKIVAFDLSNKYICTIECCKEIDPRGILKFFYGSGETSDNYSLQLSVEGVIFNDNVQVCSRPGFEDEFAILTESIQVWGIVRDKWELKHEIGVRSSQSAVLAIDYSSDGSFIAAVFSKLIVLWNAENDYACFGEISVAQECKTIKFGQGLSAKYLCLSTEKETIFIDVTTSKVAKKFDFNVTNIVSEPELGCFSAFVPEKHCIIVFQPDVHFFTDTISINFYNFEVEKDVKNVFPLLVKKMDTADLNTSEQVPNWCKKITLVCVTDQWKLLKLDHADSNRDFSMLQTTSKDFQLFNLISEHRSLTYYTHDNSIESKLRTHKFENYVAHELYNHPAHLLPGPDKLFQELVQRSLPGFIHKTSQGKVEGNDSAIEEDKSSSDEDFSSEIPAKKKKDLTDFTPGEAMEVDGETKMLCEVFALDAFTSDSNKESVDHQNFDFLEQMMSISSFD